MAGRTPELNRSDSKKHWPSVMEMTFVGMNAEDVVRFGLDDRQTRHRAAAHFVGELRAALQEAAVQVKDVTGVGLAAGGTAQEQGHGAIRLCLLGQVVEDDQHVLAAVHPVLADGRSGVTGPGT